MKRFLNDASEAERLIFVEPIKEMTKDNEEEEEWGPEPDQQMVIRSESKYIKLFKDLGLEILC